MTLHSKFTKKDIKTRLAHNAFDGAHIECLQYGLEHGLHKKDGWSWKYLLLDGVVEDTPAAKRE